MRRTRFRRLGLLYITALSGIALSIIASQSLVQSFIGSQEDDSRVINVAGRQRMLSQKISKLVLKLNNKQDKQTLQELNATVELWEKSHNGLLHGDIELGLSGSNSEEVIRMYDEITPIYEEMVTSVHSIIASSKDSIPSLNQDIQIVLDNESKFLSTMDRIVFQYDDEAKSRVIKLRRVEIGLFVVSMLIILLELLFIFRPIARNVQQTVNELTDSEESSNKMAKQMSKLYDELVKSYQDLESVNVKPETASLLLSIKKDGSFINKTHNFFHRLNIQSSSDFKTLLFSNGYSEDFVNGLFQNLSNGENWFGELKFTSHEGDFVWLEAFLVPIVGLNEIKVIGREVTEIKEAKMISREINSEKIERKVKEQQYRSVLILEGQEEERQRLARELHDGVGQMLSALKMSIEAVNIPKEPVHNKKRFDDTKYLLKRVIQEVRRISFNLMPTNLADFGIVPAVKKFCQEVSRLSNLPVTFENKTSFINRLEQHVESNLYRIIQEAVNNAVKYSKAKSIKVVFEHSVNLLTVSIEDDGKGFNYGDLLAKGHFKSSGHGIYNMRERAAFIDATFELETSPNRGTKIFVSLPLE